MSLQDDINLLTSRISSCKDILWEVEDGLDWREPSQFQKAVNGGIGYIAVANRAVLDELIEAMQHFVYGYTSSFGYLAWNNVHQGLYNMEPDMSLAAWVLRYANAPDDVRSAHTTIIDAYRASMYDKPFDLEYHQLWIQRFKSWV